MGSAEEDWQAQVEELVALQSIYGEASFRLLSAPSPDRTADASSSGDSSGSSGAGGDHAEHSSGDEELLQSMLGQPRPDGTGPLVAEVLAEVELPPGGLQITLLGKGGPESSGGDGGGGDRPESGNSGGDGGGGMPVGERVRWLPPLRVVITLPDDYPSAAPPNVSVHAGWLRAAQRAELEGGLLAAWREQGAGFPVIFSFLEWLRESALGALGVSDCLGLWSPSAPGGGRGGEAGGGCGRQCSGSHAGRSGSGGRCGHGQGAPCGGAVERGALESGSGGGGTGESSSCGAGGGSVNGGSDDGGGALEAPAAEHVAMQLLRCHAAKEQEEFDSSQQRCAVCFEEHPGASCVRLPSCRHHFCRGCLQQLCSTHVKEGSVEALRCPDPGCRLPLPPHVLQALLSAAEFERWEGLLLQRTLDRMQDLVYCPRCETPCIEDPDHFAHCAACYYVFCAMCLGGWHPGSACVDEEARLLIMSRRRARGGAGAKDARAEMDLVQQLASLRVLKESSKPCPGCKFPIEKTEGCNKMTCAYCSSFWCWRCEEVISGYDHFRDGGCRLFEQAEIDRWNALFAAERAADAAAGGGGGQGWQIGGPGARRTHCPSCGQATFQANRNNLVRCWACASHYCAACGKALRGRVGQHFIGANACKQHA